MKCKVKRWRHIDVIIWEFVRRADHGLSSLARSFPRDHAHGPWPNKTDANLELTSPVLPHPIHPMPPSLPWRSNPGRRARRRRRACGGLIRLRVTGMKCSVHERCRGRRLRPPPSHCYRAAQIDIVFDPALVKVWSRLRSRAREGLVPCSLAQKLGNQPALSSIFLPI